MRLVASEVEFHQNYGPVVEDGSCRISFDAGNGEHAHFSDEFTLELPNAPDGTQPYLLLGVILQLKEDAIAEGRKRIPAGLQL